MPNVIIHLGANKTGSTTLQRYLFAKTPDLAYLGEDCLNYDEHRDILNSLVSDDDIHFNITATKLLFEHALGTTPGKTAIYSNEDIMASRVPTLCAQRLHKLLPDAKILVIIRNQLTAIPSWYVNHGAYLKLVPRRYWKRYVSFNDWMAYCTEFIKYSPLDSFFFHRILKLYASLFGIERINILLYEDFVSDSQRFIRRLSDILNIDPHEAMERLSGKRERKRNSMRMHKYHKFRSGFFYNKSISQYLPFGKTAKQMLITYLENGKPASDFMSDYWRSALHDLYEEDNKNLAAEFKLPLKEYGYPMPFSK